VEMSLILNVQRLKKHYKNRNLKIACPDVVRGKPLLDEEN